LIDGLVVGGDGWVACSLLVWPMEWEIQEQQGWQRPCNKTPPSPHWTWVEQRNEVEQQKRIEAREGERGGGSERERV